MSKGAPQWYISNHETIDVRCSGCTHVVPILFGGDIGRLICNRYPYPRNQFVFSLDGRCEHYYLSTRLRELISHYENILIKKINVKSVEEVDGNCEDG